MTFHCFSFGSLSEDILTEHIAHHINNCGVVKIQVLEIYVLL